MTSLSHPAPKSLKPLGKVPYHKRTNEFVKHNKYKTWISVNMYSDKAEKFIEDKEI